MKNENFLPSLKTSVSGLAIAFMEENNFRKQFVIGIVVIFLMIGFDLNSIEKSILLLTILVVLSLELINSQIEKFLDVVQPELHPKVKEIKDFSAGAVLLASFGSVIIGVLIFLPYMADLFGKCK